MRQQPLPGFAHYRVADRPCTRHRHPSAYDLYVDQANYAQLVANLAGE